MRAYRASRAFDGERTLPSGALVLVNGSTIRGADSGAGPAKPYGSMRESVTDMADAAISCTEVLAAGTGEAARTWGLDGRTGRLNAGLDAALLIVARDSLNDITALRARISLRLARTGSP